MIPHNGYTLREFPSPYCFSPFKIGNLPHITGGKLQVIYKIGLFRKKSIKIYGYKQRVSIKGGFAGV
jgi:hypothetical protein